MANKPKTHDATPQATESTVVETIATESGLAKFLSTTFIWDQDHVYTGRTMPLPFLIYCLQYGMGKAKQDSVAGVKKAFMGDGDQAWTFDDRVAMAADMGMAWTKENDADKALLEKFRDKTLVYLAEQRRKDAEQGKVGTRGPRGPRKSSDEKLREEIALNFWKAKAESMGKALPKADSPEYKEIFAKVLTLPQVEEEFQRRKTPLDVGKIEIPGLV